MPWCWFGLSHGAPPSDLDDTDIHLAGKNAELASLLIGGPGTETPSGPKTPSVPLSCDKAVGPPLGLRP